MLRPLLRWGLEEVDYSSAVLKIEIHYQRRLKSVRSPMSLNTPFPHPFYTKVMGKLVVKLIESGIGFTSEAIHAARNRSSNGNSISNSSPRDASTEQRGQFVLDDEEITRELVREKRAQRPSSNEIYTDQHYAELPAANEPSIHQQHAELPAVSQPSIHQQYAELPAVSEPSIHQQYAELPPANGPSSRLDECQQNKSTGVDNFVDGKATPTAAEPRHDLDEYNDSIYSVDMQHEFSQAEAVWTQTENLQHGRLPTYEESEWAPVALARAGAGETTEVQEQYINHPSIPTEQPVDRSQGLTYPVVIPQYKPSTKTPTFERAYAPILANYGICQDVFLRFLGDFEQANMVRSHLLLRASPDSRFISDGRFRIHSGSTLSASQRIYRTRSLR